MDGSTETAMWSPRHSNMHTVSAVDKEINASTKLGKNGGWLSNKDPKKKIKKKLMKIPKWCTSSAIPDPPNKIITVDKLMRIDSIVCLLIGVLIATYLETDYNHSFQHIELYILAADFVSLDVRARSMFLCIEKFCS